jgi:hypothetical protein
LTDALERHQFSTPSDTGTPQTELPGMSFQARASTAAAIDQKATREVPGETWIGADETAGLPQMTPEEYHEEKATQQQPQKQSFWARFAFGSQEHKVHRRRKSRSQDSEVDVEHSAESFSAAPRFGRGSGILSSLLTLYDASNTPGTLTPANSSYEDLLSAAANKNGRYGRHHLPHAASSASSLSATEKPPSISRRTGFPFHDTRPVSARSGAGVFGALVASTANLSGPAAPTSSSPAPSVKRPGYHLSRLV